MNDLIIALYRETDSLKLLEKYSLKYNYRPIIYNKGGLKVKSSLFKNINLPNIGLHTHSYLYHIVENYENLSDVTIFLLGSAFRDIKKAKKANWILQNGNKCKGFMAQHIWLSDEIDYQFELPYYEVYDYSKRWLKANSKRIKTKMIRAETKPLGKWIENNINQTLQNKRFLRSSKCIFAAHKNLIHSKPLSYWEDLLSQVNKESEDIRNLEVVHFFERAWLCIFISNPTIEDLQHDTSTYGPINFL